MKGDFYNAIYAQKMYALGRPVINFVDNNDVSVGPPIAFILEPTPKQIEEKKKIEKATIDAVDFLNQLLQGV